MVVGFWAYATDLSTPDQAKRLFGVIGGGGIIGGLVGISLTRILLKNIGMQGLLFMAAGFMGGVILVTYLTESWVTRSAAFQRAARERTAVKEDSGKLSKMGAALEG